MEGCLKKGQKSSAPPLKWLECKISVHKNPKESAFSTKLVTAGVVLNPQPLWKYISSDNCRNHLPPIFRDDNIFVDGQHLWMFGTSYQEGLGTTKADCFTSAFWPLIRRLYILYMYGHAIHMYIYIHIFCIKLLMSKYLKVSEIELILRLQVELRNQAVVSLALINHHLKKSVSNHAYGYVWCNNVTVMTALWFWGFWVST